MIFNPMRHLIKKNIFLTGLPGVGKTTLLKQIIKDLDCGGFYTEEIKEKNKRVGFKIKTLDGKEGILARVDLKSEYKLGKYRINLKDLEEIAVEAIKKALRENKIIVIDEVGKMEFFSEKFKEVVFEALDSEKIVIGVLHRDFKDLLKKRNDTEIWEVTPDNHKDIFKKCKDLLPLPTHKIN